MMPNPSCLAIEPTEPADKLVVRPEALCAEPTCVVGNLMRLADQDVCDA
jgi:hypothetical protein